MAQHFLLSAAARSLSPAKVARMSDRGAENVFLRVRWPETDGKPVCPHCGCQVCYDCRRSSGQARWRCKACGADFSVTSGTLFAWHKLPLRTYSYEENPRLCRGGWLSLTFPAVCLRLFDRTTRNV